MTSWQLVLTIFRGKALWRRRTLGSNLATLLVALMFLAIGFGEYFGFREFFTILNDLEQIQPVVIAFSLFSLFLVIFVLIIASTLISSPFVLLNKKDTNFLLPLPIRDHIIFGAHFFEQILMSMWIGLLFGIPAILSLRVVSDNFWLIIDGLLFLMVLILLAIIIGNVLMLIVMSATKRFNFRVSFLMIISIVALLIILLAQTNSPQMIFSLLESNNPEGNQTAITNLVSHYYSWPAGWYVNILLSDLGYLNHLWWEKILLVSAGLIGILFQSLLVLGFYKSILQSSQINHSLYLRASSLLKYQGRWLFIVREWAAIIRDRRDIGQFIFFLALMVIYVVFIMGSKSVNNGINSTWTPRIISYMMITICYFIVLIALRFVFPLSSSDRANSWYFLILPQYRLRNFTARLLAFSVPTLIIIEFVIWFTLTTFNFNFWFKFPLLLLIPFVVVFMIVLANTFGIFFPVQGKTDPQSVSTTPSGLALFVLMSIYSVFISFAIFHETKNGILMNFQGIYPGFYYWLIVFSSAILILILWRIGQKKSEKFYLE